ncbi:MAG: hypothetical protein RJA22_3 [Verrucomicrobiota bacterium]|jgi:hypothetical protein
MKSIPTVLPSGDLAVRVNPANPDHHLWNNHGTWWCHYTLHLPDFTKRRVRRNLGTPVLAEARLLRDQILAANRAPLAAAA